MAMKEIKDVNELNYTMFMDWVTPHNNTDASFLQNQYTGLMQFLSKFQQKFFC